MSTPSSAPEALDLIERMSRQDREAFSRFYDLFSALSFTVALRILRVRADAEDLLQEVFMQIWHKAADYNPKRGRPEAWVITITKSRAIDKLRSRRRRDMRGEALEEMSLNQSREAETRGDVQAEVRLTVEGAMGELSDVQKEALEMAYFGGLTQTEIAEKLEIPIGTVKTRIRDGLKRLRAVLKMKSGEKL